MRRVRKIKAGLMTVKIFLIIPCLFFVNTFFSAEAQFIAFLFRGYLMMDLVKPCKFYKQQCLCDVVIHVSKYSLF